MTGWETFDLPTLLLMPRRNQNLYEIIPGNLRQGHNLPLLPELPRGGSAAQMCRTAAFTPLQRGQTKAGDHFHHPVVVHVEAT